MLIFTWSFIKDTIIPVLGSIFTVGINAMMPLVIMCVGICVLLSIVGIRTGGVFGTIANGAVRGLGYIGRTVLSALGWCARHLIQFIPVFYVGIRNSFRRNGSSEITANLVSFFATVILILIIIWRWVTSAYALVIFYF